VDADPVADLHPEERQSMLTQRRSTVFADRQGKQFCGSNRRRG
jgi:hypothetical protein